MSAALFGHVLTLNFLLGVSVVFISMHLFFTMGAQGGGARRWGGGAGWGGAPEWEGHARLFTA